MAKAKRGVTYDEYRQIALAFPGVEEGTSFGMPAFKVRGKFMSRLREEDVLVLKPVYDDEQQFLMGTQPEAFFLTDHYRGYTAILVRLSQVDPAELRRLVEQAWRELAPKKLVADHDAAPAAAAPRSTRRRR